MSNENDDLTDHNYDGIEEYDNPLPLWWTALFIGTVIFSFIYWLHYEIAGGPTLNDELKIEMARLEKKSRGAILPTDSEADLLKLLTSNDALATGKAIYDAKCAVCHGAELQGIIGPNLVDDYWIQGKGKLTEVSQLVRKGVLDRGMPAWDSMLKSDEIKSVVAFIAKNKGTKPPNPKAPQGELGELVELSEKSFSQ